MARKDLGSVSSSLMTSSLYFSFDENTFSVSVVRRYLSIDGPATGISNVTACAKGFFLFFPFTVFTIFSHSCLHCYHTLSKIESNFSKIRSTGLLVSEVMLNQTFDFTFTFTVAWFPS